MHHGQKVLLLFSNEVTFTFISSCFNCIIYIHIIYKADALTPGRQEACCLLSREKSFYLSSTPQMLHQPLVCGMFFSFSQALHDI